MLSIYGGRACSAAPTFSICYPELNQVLLSRDGTFFGLGHDMIHSVVAVV